MCGVMPSFFHSAPKAYWGEVPGFWAAPRGPSITQSVLLENRRHVAAFYLFQGSTFRSRSCCAIHLLGFCHENVEPISSRRTRRQDDPRVSRTFSNSRMFSLATGKRAGVARVALLTLSIWRPIRVANLLNQKMNEGRNVFLAVREARGNCSGNTLSR